MTQAKRKRVYNTEQARKTREENKRRKKAGLPSLEEERRASRIRRRYVKSGKFTNPEKKGRNYKNATTKEMMDRSRKMKEKILAAEKKLSLMSKERDGKKTEERN